MQYQRAISNKDISQLAKFLVDQATGEIPPKPEPTRKGESHAEGALHHSSRQFHISKGARAVPSGVYGNGHRRLRRIRCGNNRDIERELTRRHIRSAQSPRRTTDKDRLVYVGAHWFRTVNWRLLHRRSLFHVVGRRASWRWPNH